MISSYEKEELSVFWFRRDLRLNDNAGLYYALKENKKVLPLFIFDKNILDQLENKNDRRVDFIHQALVALHAKLTSIGSSLLVLHASPLEAFRDILNRFSIKRIYANHDYEPYGTIRDNQLKLFFKENAIEFKTYKDQCIFEKEEIIKDDGSPYTIFTPYSRKWKKSLSPWVYKSYRTESYFQHFIQMESRVIPALESLGFLKTDIVLPKKISADSFVLQKYKEQRDFPAVNGTSRLSVHLRFGTISIRSLVAKALPLSETWLNELIWRDFYMMILSHFPHVVESAFKKQYDHIPWRNKEEEFEKWCEGKTGFPIVDAGMRELNATGFMHNRVRMIVSSFLVKDLLIDWRWGEAYFANKLNDFDLSANNGGWQWAAGSGCDAAPYFRIFNPTEQQKRFDPEFEYIKRWIPGFGSSAYPSPIVDHAQARLRTLKVYKNALNDFKQMSLSL